MDMVLLPWFVGCGAGRSNNKDTARKVLGDKLCGLQWVTGLVHGVHENHHPVRCIPLRTVGHPLAKSLQIAAQLSGIRRDRVVDSESVFDLLRDCLGHRLRVGMQSAVAKVVAKGTGRPLGPIGEQGAFPNTWGADNNKNSALVPTPANKALKFIFYDVFPTKETSI